MPNPILESGLAAMAFARRNTLAFVEDVPDEKLCHQPVPGANHAAWVLGHLAYSDDVFVSGVGGRPVKCSEAWQKQYGMGSTPTASRSAYPSKAELMDQLAARRADLVAWFQSLNEEQLAAPLPEGWTDFAPNQAAFPAAIVWHEGMHAGQLTVVRKSLGIPPKMG